MDVVWMDGPTLVELVSWWMGWMVGPTLVEQVAWWMWCD